MDDKTIVIGIACLGALYLFIMLKHHLDSNREYNLLSKRMVARRLRKLGKEYHVINNQAIETNHGICGIDHLVTSPYGIFLIETKNYGGNVYGSAGGPQWTQKVMGIQHDQKNPIMQNMRHIKTLRSLAPEIPGKAFVSMVAFPKRTKLHVYAGEDNHLTRFKSVAQEIKQFKEKILTAEQICQFEENLNKRDERMTETNLWSNRHRGQHTMAIENDNGQYGQCPICGGQLVRRSNSAGHFFGCEHYPECGFNTK